MIKVEMIGNITKGIYLSLLILIIIMIAINWFIGDYIDGMGFLNDLISSILNSKVSFTVLLDNIILIVIVIAVLKNTISWYINQSIINKNLNIEISKKGVINE
ncbi:MAG: hypothetical protein HRT99_00550 [Mycoplasmatales bacterium]|nr:hypothetical protein [Mycoplasmatales bacterium]